MPGLSGIAAANGWMITVVGLSIVFLGLCVLAAFLAKLDKLLELWDKTVQALKTPRRRPEVKVPHAVAESREGAPPSAGPSEQEVFLAPEAMETYESFRLLTAREGSAFSLPKVLEQAEKRGIPRPHYYLDQFLVLGLIEELPGENKGFYRWASGKLIRQQSARAQS